MSYKYQIWISSVGGKPIAYAERDTKRQANAYAKKRRDSGLVVSINAVPISLNNCESYSESYEQHRTHPY